MPAFTTKTTAFGRVAPAPEYSLTRAASFDDVTGINPEACLTIDGSGNLYGTTVRGGTSGKGNVFRVLASTSVITTIVTFNGANGANPQARLAFDDKGNLYGTTVLGGANNKGTVFKIAKATEKFAIIASFNGDNGAYPKAGVTLDSRGNLYGTTTTTSLNDHGTVFKIAAGTSTITTMVTFVNENNGEEPTGNLALDSRGNLYGTAQRGGFENCGTVFKIAAGTNALTTIVTFNYANGAYPYSGLTMDKSGNLYGATANGGASDYSGIVFKIAAGTNELTTLATFTGDNGSNPEASLALDDQGNLYGTTPYDGGDLFGTVFKIAVGSGKVTTLVTFTTLDDFHNGDSPYSSVIRDGHGSLYGTTEFGGANDKGMVFKLTPTSVPATP